MFEIPDDNPRYRRSKISLAGLFWTQLASTTIGVLIAGVVLFFGLRFYIAWSVADAVEKIDRRNHTMQKRP